MMKKASLNTNLPAPKRSRGINITYQDLESLRYSVQQVPENTPRRWDLIATIIKGFNSSICNNCSPQVVLASKDGANCARDFECTASECRDVVKILVKEYCGSYIGIFRCEIDPIYMFLR